MLLAGMTAWTLIYYYFLMKSTRRLFMEKSCKCGGLCAGSFGISLGLVSGIIMMLLAWVSHWWGMGSSLVDQWSTIYKGYESSIQGGFIGLGWGFLEGLIVGWVWASIYNCICCCCKCKRCKCCKGEEIKPMP